MQTEGYPIPTGSRNGSRLKNIALIGCYVPRECGIATFTKDLRDSIHQKAGTKGTFVLAMDDTPEGYEYPDDVSFQLRATNRGDYATASVLLNINDIDVLVVQHEYGIFGGPDGSYILDLIGNVRVPVITTLHTVLTEPSPGQARVMFELAKLSDRFVVMSHFASTVLQKVYDVPKERIAVIPHGIPDMPFTDSARYKGRFGLANRKVILTFGLLGPGKGIEYAIQALPEICARHPDVVYVLVGATHPHVLKRDGDAYRNSLERLAERLRVREHVVFRNRFVTLEELCGYIAAADVYITPYLNKAQITSGTLAYAAGAGKAVVSTPYLYAEELLAEGRGRLVAFRDSQSISNAVNDLFDNEDDCDAMRKRAYAYCRNMVWNEVGQSYIRLAADVVRERQRRPRAVSLFPEKAPDLETLPEVNMAHLKNLTDDTGLLQHAVYSVPNRHHGYCSDDNARALQAVLMHFDLYKDESVLPLANTYLGFLHHSFDPDQKRFHNFMTYDRRWLDHEEGQDVHGRVINALAWAADLAPNDSMRSLAVRLFQQSIESIDHFRSPRTQANAIIGIHIYLRKLPGDSQARRARAELANRLYTSFAGNSSPDWPWCEDTVTYDNGKLPHALILGGQAIPDPAMLEQGLRSLQWLVDLQLASDSSVHLIGNRGWLTRQGQRAPFDQQPIEVMALVEACAEAYRCTGEVIWRDRARAFLGWFLGSNETQTVIYDFVTGGCRDGLHPDGANVNEGAESTLAWLISLLTINDLYRIPPDPKPVLISSRAAIETQSPRTFGVER